jgi:hypothetical protein
MIASVDGRILTSRWWPKGVGTGLFERLHELLGGDAWLVGRVTGQESAKAYPDHADQTYPREPWFAETASHMSSLMGPRAPVVEIPEARHHVMLDQPLGFVAALRILLGSWMRNESAEGKRYIE